ncbi:MAG TPA: hypothetical protein VF005_00170 [Acidimicrobiales bacterium]
MALVAVMTVGAADGVELVGALVVLVLEVVDEDPQAAAMTAAGTSPIRMARRDGVQRWRRPGDGLVLLGVVAVWARITGFLLHPCGIAMGWASSLCYGLVTPKDCKQIAGVLRRPWPSPG